MDEIKKAAAERGKEMGLSYAGALLPAEAHKLMRAGAKLVDVRTKPELLYVGKARSIRVVVPKEEIPELEDVEGPAW